MFLRNSESTDVDYIAFNVVLVGSGGNSDPRLCRRHFRICFYDRVCISANKDVCIHRVRTLQTATPHAALATYFSAQLLDENEHCSTGLLYVFRHK
jgi:hypothetical protein